jgi:hypothetical protein
MEINYELTKKQTEAWRYLTDSKNRDILFGGAKGGAKTFLLCLWSYLWTKGLIEFFELPPSTMPIPIGFIGRKRSVDFMDTTFETWKKIIPPQAYTFRERDKEIVIENRAKICYGGLDDTLTIKKFNSAELAFFAIDQAEETERADVGILEGTLRLTYKGKIPPYKTLYTANPAECWLKEDFVYGGRPDGIYIRALPIDNPHLPQNYLEQLEKAFGYDPFLLKAYRDGNWDITSSDYVIIPTNLIDDLKNIVHFPEGKRKAISCDPSTGGDECVIYVFEEYRVVDQRILHYDDTMKITGEIMLLSHQYDINTIGVDTIGIGKGIGDRLVELGKEVIFINSAESAENPNQWYNKRIEMWWKVREKIQAKEIPYPQDEELRRQLTAPFYKVINSNGKIQLESKQDTKKKLNRSPDRADAFVYGISIIDKMEKTTVWEKDIRRYSKRETGFFDKMVASIRGY